MEENKIVEEIYHIIEKYGLVPTIKKLFGVGAKIEIPFSETARNTAIEKLDISIRSYNCLKRDGFDTVGKVIDVVSEDKLWKVHSLGKKSRADIRVGIFNFGYSCLSERERKVFVKGLLEQNKDKYNVVF